MFKANSTDACSSSDIETNSSLVLSNCSGDTDFELRRALIHGEFEDTIEKHCATSPFAHINGMSQQEFDKNTSELEDELLDLEIKRKFDKMLVKQHDDINNDNGDDYVDSNQSKKLFYSIWFKTEWNENGLKIPFMKGIEQGIIILFSKDKNINSHGKKMAIDVNIFDLISSYIAIAPDRNDLEMRRIKFWNDKSAYFENESI